MQELIEQVVDYLKGIWIKRRYIIIATWFICPIGWYIVASLPDIYESEARVYVDTQSLLRPLLRGLTVETNPEITIRRMGNTLKSRPNLERISRMTDLDVQANTTEEYDVLLDELKKDLKISAAGRENIYTVSIENEDPELAKNIVQSAVTVFIENTLGESRNDSDEAQKFLNSQIREYENRLLEAENRLTLFKQKYSHLSLGDQGGYYQAVKAEKQRLEEAQLNLAEAQTRLDSAKAQLVGEEPVFGLFSSRVETNNRVTTTYDSRILQLEQNLDALLLRYTDNHPEVKELKRQLDSINQKREQEIKEYYDSIKASSANNTNSAVAIDQNPVYQELKIQVNQYQNEVASLTVRVNSFKTKLAELENKIHTLPEIEAELTALNRGYNITKQKYEELLSRKETAELAKQAEETTDNIQFRVIDPARAALQPSGPPRFLLFGAVTIIGIGAGIALSLAVSQINPVVTSSRQLTKETGFPVFGSVSASENLGLHQWHKRKTIIFMLSNLMLLAILSLFIAYFMFPDAIQAPIKRLF